MQSYFAKCILPHHTTESFQKFVKISFVAHNFHMNLLDKQKKLCLIENDSRSLTCKIISIKNAKRFHLKQFKIIIPHRFPLNILINFYFFFSPLHVVFLGNPLNENHIRWERVDYEMSAKTKSSYENGTSYLHISNAQR